MSDGRVTTPGAGKLLYNGRAPVVGIFDDDPGTLDVLSRYFQHFGFEVVTGTDGDDAIRLVADMPLDDRPDVAILDVMMPSVDGFDVAAKIRAVDPVLPIIMFTARVDQRDKIRGLLTGAHRYLTKPCSPATVVDAAARLLGLSTGTPAGRRKVADVTGDLDTVEMPGLRRPVTTRTELD